MAKKIRNELFPSNREIYSWIEDLTQWGHRKTGTAEGQKSAEYIANKFKEMGMRDVRMETVPAVCMFPQQYSLEIDGSTYETFYANGTNRAAKCGKFEFNEAGCAQEFLYLGDGLEGDFQQTDVAGKIVVCSIRFLGSAPRDMLNWFEKADTYDPQGQLMRVKEKPDIYSPNNWPFNYFRAMRHGAAGFVGILEDYMDDPYWYCEDYSEQGYSLGFEYMQIPALWISRSSGKKLKDAFKTAEILKGTMEVTTSYQYKDALNVSGRLEGQSDEIIMVHSHHDAVFDGAVQDASGISEMLALGSYFSRLTPEERKKTMMFVATDTHYADYQGHLGFIKARQKEGDRIILDVAIEHIGKESILDEQGRQIETGEVESRMVYVSAQAGLYDFVRSTFEKYHLNKSIFAQAELGKGIASLYEFRQSEIISDAYYFNESGIPVISTVSGQIYLFHPSDKVDRIPIDQLVPVGKAFTEIVLEAAERL